MRILTLNAGSNSLKFEVIDVEPDGPEGRKGGFGRSLVSGAYDEIGKPDAAFSLLEGKRPRDRQQIEVRHHGQAAELLFDWIEKGNAWKQGVARLSDIERVSHRVVHGADRFDRHTRITDQVIRQIEDLKDLAPLHNASALQVIRAAQGRMPPDTPMIAIFDTVFHRSIPDEAALYPLPLDLAARHRIRRYGFHGISHKYLMLRYGQITGRPVDQVSVITAHLEGGSSVCAIRHGQSIDTSMGFSPLEGLMMGTRCGDIDPAIVTYLMRQEKMSGEQVETFLNKKCGLLAVSGRSADTRELLKHLDDPHVALALRMFSYRARKYIGAYLAALGGAEAIILGGGICENTALVREQICDRLEWGGAVLDRTRNEQVIDREGPITAAGSKLRIFVIPTQEGWMMAKETANWNENEK